MCQFSAPGFIQKLAEALDGFMKPLQASECSGINWSWAEVRFRGCKQAFRRGGTCSNPQLLNLWILRACCIPLWFLDLLWDEASSFRTVVYTRSHTPNSILQGASSDPCFPLPGDQSLLSRWGAPSVSSHCGQPLPGSVIPAGHACNTLAKCGWPRWHLGAVAVAIPTLPRGTVSASLTGKTWKFCSDLQFGDHTTHSLTYTSFLLPYALLSTYSLLSVLSWLDFIQVTDAHNNQNHMISWNVSLEQYFIKCTASLVCIGDMIKLKRCEWIEGIMHMQIIEFILEWSSPC